MGGLTSDFLFAEPDELSGVARLWDFSGTFDAYNVSRSTEEADIKAVLADWHMVGKDLKKAMDSTEK
jgi:hypothetical protein